LWPLALITLSGTSAMHMFVPALPVAAQDLTTSPALVQLTISVYILALGLGQLVFGPLSDSFGRRPLLLAGLLLFTLGGLAAALAPNVHVLLAARFAQALGGCVGMLLPRAIVRDTSGVDEAVRRLSLMGLMTLVGPGLAPLIGGTVAHGWGWRAVFGVLACLGAVNLLLAWRMLPETGSPTGRISVASVLADYRLLLGTRRFVGLAIGGGCASTTTYAFITAAPFIFVQQLHRPVPEVGLYLGLMILGAGLPGGRAHRQRPADGRCAPDQPGQCPGLRRVGAGLGATALGDRGPGVPARPGGWLVHPDRVGPGGECGSTADRVCLRAVWLRADAGGGVLCGAGHPASGCRAGRSLCDACLRPAGTGLFLDGAPADSPG
jgi:multidrug resistance protein